MIQFVINMSKAYDKYLQQEAEEWREGMDSETTDGLLMDLTGEPLEEDNPDDFIYKTTGMF